jgi:rhodanese-related sulfurtransferase
MAFQKAGPGQRGRRLFGGIAAAGLIASVGGSIMADRDANPAKTVQTRVEVDATTANRAAEGKMTAIATGKVNDISVRDIAGMHGKVRFVDVREPHEYTGELGHIDGAELVPLATVGVAMQSWNPDEAVVLICRSGGRSGRAAEMLVQSGFKQVMNMAGGMLAYDAANLPVVR